jgi:hypothetical protein
MRFLIVFAIALSLTILWQTSTIAAGERTPAQSSSLYQQAGAVELALPSRN